jgi:tetratricopeptide (TPR) repeat protein
MQNTEADKVIELYTNYINECKKIRREYSAAIYTGNLGFAYEFIGQYDKALELFNFRLEYSKKIGNKSGVNLMLMNKGITYLSIYEYAKALKCFNQSIKGYQEIKSGRNIPQLFSNKAYAFYGLEKYSEAKKWALKSQQLMKGKILHYDLTNDLQLLLVRIEYVESKNYDFLPQIENYVGKISNAKDKGDVYYELWKSAIPNNLPKEKELYYRSQALEIYSSIAYRKEVAKRLEELSKQL